MRRAALVGIAENGTIFVFQLSETSPLGSDSRSLASSETKGEERTTQRQKGRLGGASVSSRSRRARDLSTGLMEFQIRWKQICQRRWRSGLESG